MEHVKIVRHKPNPAYKPVKGTKINDPATILANGVVLNEVEYTAADKRHPKNRILDTKPQSIEPGEEYTLRLEMQNVRDNNRISVVPIRLTRLAEGTEYSFSSETLLYNAIECEKQVNKLGNITCTFKHLAPGDYLVHRSSDRKTFLIRIPRD